MDKYAIRWIVSSPLLYLCYTWVCNQQYHIVMSKESTKRKTSKGNICPEHVFILQGKGGFIRIAVDDITFLRAARDYCEIHTQNQETLVVSVPMADVYHCIPPTKFIRISRSITLNQNFITKIIGNQIELIDKTRLKIGKTYRDEILSGFIMIGSRRRKK